MYINTCPDKYLETNADYGRNCVIPVLIPFDMSRVYDKPSIEMAHIPKFKYEFIGYSYEARKYIYRFISIEV